MIHIANARLGHACNSSSTHSILILPPGIKARSFPTDTESEFGWGNWTAADPQAKANYAALIIGQALEPRLGAVILGSLGVTPTVDPDARWETGRYGYVDHQSVPTLPLDPAGHTSVAFAEDWAKFLLREDVVILGGDDNGTDEHPLRSLVGSRSIRMTHLHPDIAMYPSGARARKDGDWWTLFDPRTGDRVTFSFVDEPAPFVPRGPMLVDMKVTDQCFMGCVFCYQGSTPDGEHADYAWVSSALHAMGPRSYHEAAGVFEVAFGGGEPTLHPRWADIVQTCVDARMTPNMTTRNLEWVKDPANRHTLSHMGAVAVSVETPKALEPWLDVMNPEDRSGYVHDPQWSIQVIDGLVSERVLREMADMLEGTPGWRHPRITILGFKTTGRGEGIALPHKGAWLKWYGDLSDWKRREVAIDTVIVQQYAADLEAMGALPESYIGTEGQWSFYVDAVGRRTAASSYVADPSRYTNVERGYDVLDEGWPPR